MTERIEQLATDLRQADTAVAFTGAGVSTASGIPDFRSDDGIWQDHDPEPNPAHDALATLETQGYLDAVITQNADGLHQTAGAEEVIELHGSLEKVVCQSCRHREPFDAARARALRGPRPGGEK